MPPHSAGAIIALGVLVVCLVGLVLVLFGQLGAFPVAIFLFGIGAALAVARLV